MWATSDSNNEKEGFLKRGFGREWRGEWLRLKVW